MSDSRQAEMASTVTRAHDPALPTPNAEPILEVRGVSKSYRLGKRSVEVLREIDLTVQRGEFLALQGASGAGKSTLLHLLGGLDSPDQGEIRFAGHNLKALSPGDLARLRNLKVGLVFQAYHVLPELDALENVSLPARIARQDPGRTEAQARHLLERVNLGARMDHRPSELSGGEQQRVAVARALVNNPDLILADEPTGNLDSQTGQEIIELLSDLWRERRTTLIIATHDRRIAAQAPRVLELADGRLR